jgi:hypothetical protein
MADREQPYDPYIPAGGNANAGGSAGRDGNQRTAALQAVSHSKYPTQLYFAHARDPDSTNCILYIRRTLARE